MELAAEVPETLTQMRLFFGAAAALCVVQVLGEPILPLAEGCSNGSWGPAAQPRIPTVALKAIISKTTSELFKYRTAISEQQNINIRKCYI